VRGSGARVFVRLAVSRWLLASGDGSRRRRRGGSGRRRPQLIRGIRKGGNAARGRLGAASSDPRAPGPLKSQHEFFPVTDVPWTEDTPGISQRILASAADGTLTRIARWAPGTVSGSAVIRHDYFEEVYLLDGSLTDLTLATTFTAGAYAARRPGMPHGPYRTDEGVTMLEIRHRVT